MKTIQAIGKRPKTAPSTAPDRADTTGIFQPRMAMSRATPSADSPARWAFHRRTPSVTNMVTRGNSPTMAETHMGPSGEMSGFNAVSSMSTTCLLYTSRCVYETGTMLRIN